jgi:hypothetical protein
MAKTTRSGVLRPSWLWFLLLDGGLVLLARLVYSQKSYEKARELSRESLPPHRALRALLLGSAVLHAAEGMAAGVMARRRSLPSPWLWQLQTTIVGFPSLLALRKTARKAGRTTSVA